MDHTSFNIVVITPFVIHLVLFSTLSLIGTFCCSSVTFFKKQKGFSLNKRIWFINFRLLHSLNDMEFFWAGNQFYDVLQCIQFLKDQLSISTFICERHDVCKMYVIVFSNFTVVPGDNISF